MAKKYDHLSREDLIALHQKRDASRKLGLVWERDEIEHEAALNDDFVALDLDESLSVGEGPHRNLIIEGDNFDALRYLTIAYKGRVKCIYIDPPYNTGNKDFVYNDRYLDKEDRYRHSTWLEFIHRRLVLAKDLLASDGVIFVSIDDNEAFRLGLLMEQVFGIQNNIATFIWRKVDSPNDNKVPITPDHEFIFCFAKDVGKARFAQLPAPGILDAYPKADKSGLRYRDRLLKKNGKNSLRRDRPTMCFPLTGPDGNDVFPIHDNGEEACWAMGKAGVEKHRLAGTLIWKQRERRGKKVWEPYTREYAPAAPTRPHPTIWSDLPTMRQAKAMLRDIFDTSDLFSTPKPVELIRRILQVIDDPEALVLDFFAGSGTTAHAVLDMNKEDDGNRRFILVSSTEATKESPDLNLCRDICAERVRRAINGYTNKKGEEVLGLAAEFAYLRTTRIPIERLHSTILHDQVWTALQQLHAGVVTPYSKSDLHILDIADTDLYYVSKVSKTVLDTLTQRAKKKKPAVVFSWQPGLLTQRISSEHIAFEKIPEFLVDRFGGAK